jgi:hypothetical protein
MAMPSASWLTDCVRRLKKLKCEKCLSEGDYCDFKGAPFAVAATLFIYPECSAAGTATRLIRRHADQAVAFFEGVGSLFWNKPSRI